MGLFGHMRIHESGIDRSTDSSIMPNPTPTSPPCAPTARPATDTYTTDFTCPHCPRTCTSRIGLAGHLRIHRTETGEPVPGAPTYTHNARLNCPHCPRTFRHRMGLFGHMSIHEHLRRFRLPTGGPINSTALAVLGRARSQHQDRFDDNDAAISILFTEKNRLQKAYINRPTGDNKAAFYRSRCLVQQRLREIQEAWTVRKTEEIQDYADRNEWKSFFAAIKAVYGPAAKVTALLLTAGNNTPLTEKTQIQQR
ncbi:hypothetical protein SprV_0401649300 [Sparganum proliferum]